MHQSLTRDERIHILEKCSRFKTSTKANEDSDDHGLYDENKMLPPKPKVSKTSKPTKHSSDSTTTTSAKNVTHASKNKGKKLTKKTLTAMTMMKVLIH